MGLETATLIHELDPANPVGASDPKSQGDNHIRLLKSTIQNTFPNVDGVVTSSHTEINKLTGLTATTVELNKLAGTAAGLTAAELSVLDGITATTAELNKLAGTPAGLTATEIGFLDGVTSAIQTQLNAITALLNSNLIQSGTYTPTISNTVNLDANTPRVCQWMRIGNVVSVSGGINLDPTTNGVETQWQISLPVASDFAQVWQLAGSIGMDNQNNGFANGYIKANVANNTAEVHHFTQGLPAVEGRFHFQYLIV